MIQGVLSDRLNGEEQKKMKVINGETVKTPSSSSSSSSITTAITNNDQRCLRCPRCDSSNTKFCYYNNYNLTQPRHFCKTCRRYWTQGGALRNIPIGGGCRKGKSTTGKVKPAVASEIKPNLGNFQFNPPHHSHLLSLLRSTQNLSMGVGLNETSSGMNLLGQVAVNGFCDPPFKSPQQQQFVLGEIAGDNGVRDIWERNKQAMNYYLNDHTQGFLSSTPSSSFLELASSGMGEMGLWNSSFSWPNIHSAANGAFQ